MAVCLLGWEDGDVEGEDFQKIRNALTEWLKGLFSPPIDLPGTGLATSLTCPAPPLPSRPCCLSLPLFGCCIAVWRFLSAFSAFIGSWIAVWGMSGAGIWGDDSCSAAL